MRCIKYDTDKSIILQFLIVWQLSTMSADSNSLIWKLDHYCAPMFLEWQRQDYDNTMIISDY